VNNNDTRKRAFALGKKQHARQVDGLGIVVEKYLFIIGIAKPDTSKLSRSHGIEHDYPNLDSKRQS
jgi:hypothetical protein